MNADIRCDGYQDRKRQVCTHCKEFELDCSYLGSAATKRVKPAGYTEALETQIKLLSSELERLHPDIDLSRIAGPSLNPRTFDKQAFASQIKQLGRSSTTGVSRAPRNDETRTSSRNPLSPHSVPTPDDISMPWEGLASDSDQDMSDQEEDALAIEDDEKLMVEISHMDHVEGDPYRYISRMSMARLPIIGIAKATLSGLTRAGRAAYWSTPPWQKSVSRASMYPLDHSMWPPADLAPRLIQAYFRNHNALLPVLAETMFIRDYEVDRWKHDHAFARVCLMVFALASIVLSDDERLLWSLASSSGHDRHHSAGWNYAGEAVRMGRGASDIARLEDIQYEALMASFMAQCGDTSDAWQHVGIGLRFAVDLGIHVRAAFIRFRNPVLFEVHIRAFWVLTFWDRILSTFFGRPLVLSPNDFDVDRPTEIDDVYWRPLSLGQQPSDVLSNIAGFNVLLDITEVLASLQENGKNLTAPGRRAASKAGQQAVHNAYEGLVAKCHARLANIRESLPVHLHWDDDSASPWFQQRCSVYGILSYAEISIHSPYPDYVIHHEWSTRPDLRRRAVQAAMRGIDVSWKQARGGQINYLLWVPLTAFSCLLAAHVRCDPSLTNPGRARDDLNEAVDKCLDALTMARRWCAGWGKIRDIFKGFTAAFSDPATGPSNAAGPSNLARTSPLQPGQGLSVEADMAFLLELAAFSNPPGYMQPDWSL